ncbi:MAG: Valyl-tRNA synthetase, partial [uncultured Microvirga sp.]
ERHRAAARLGSGHRADAALPMDPRRRQHGSRRGHRRARGLSLRRLCRRQLPLHLGRLLRLVPGIRQARLQRPGRRREERGEGRRAARPRPDPPPAPPGDALRHRGAVGPLRLRAGVQPD